MTMTNRAAVLAAAFLLLLLAVLDSGGAVSSSTTVLVDSTGSVVRSPAAPPTSSGGGIVAVVGDYHSLGLNLDGDDGSVSLTASASDDDSSSPSPPLILTARFGSGHTGTSGAGYAGVGSASMYAGCVVVAGANAGDVERGLENSAGAGRNLRAVFGAKLGSASAAAGGEEEKVLLIVAVKPESGDDDLDEEAVLEGVREVFDAEAAVAAASRAASSDGQDEATTPELEDVYEVKAMALGDEEDARKIMEVASSAAAARTSSASSPVSSIIGSAYASLAAAFGGTSSASSSSSSDSSSSPAVASAILACDAASSRCRRSSRARLSSWKSRASRGLVVERFGREASALLSRTMGTYDRDTSIAAGETSSGAAAYRLEVRERLRSKVVGGIEGLFEMQVETLKRRYVKSFDRALLGASRSDDDGRTAADERAIARRTALFGFEASVKDLEVPALGLVKSAAVRDMEVALNDALVAFEDGPATKLRDMKNVQRAAAREKQTPKPTETSVDAKLDFVAMVRPDGYGNIQGFVGYQAPWGSQITVGVQNDADSPDVISQFGGVRPPFLRVQPKLKLDIEL